MEVSEVKQLAPNVSCAEKQQEVTSPVHVCVWKGIVCMRDVDLATTYNDISQL